ncbi:MAG: hypothetical protein JNL01_13470 [Bdellovibrionales bacterium]|nr:hypothetical protein [Bdellovibrionales bacterium]
MDSKSAKAVVGQLDQWSKKDFESNRRVLSFEEYLSLVAESPTLHLRGSSRYAVEMMDFYGKTAVKDPSLYAGSGGQIYRFKIFDAWSDGLNRKVVGQESVQTQIYNSLKSFARQGVNNKMLLLHGPNGSAKSSLIQSLMAGLERYSHENTGALYSFSWVFPVEKAVKGGIGLGGYSGGSTKESTLTTYAKLPDEEVLARIPCELRDHPFLLIPASQRKSALAKFIGDAKVEELWAQMPHYLTRGDLSHRNKLIFDALMTANNGDLKKVLMHIQVERFYLSRRYREGLVTIEPQMHVDAQYQMLTMNRSLGSLPPSLQSLNLFSLSGDLIDGNRGLVEYSDLLKRPIDSFKYLLIACETGSVNVGNSIAHLDTLLMGSTNELQLDAFKEFPDFMSFKARIELIKVPYLLSVTEEKEIYQPDLEQVNQEKHVAPHTDWALALWAVLTRLKKPNSINYPPNISSIVSSMTPLQKSSLYSDGEVPENLNAEDRKVLRAAIRKLKEEYGAIPYYEGRMGASPREMKSILHAAAQNSEFSCLTPLAVMRELEEFVKRVTEYEFLKQDVKDGYHDAAEFISVVRNEYLNVIDREVRDCMGLYDRNQWEDFIKKYVQHVALAIKKEKIKNPITGKMEDPDYALIDEFEKIVQAPKEGAERDSFRQNMITQVGAWSLDHPGQTVIYARVFPEYWHRLESHYYESQKETLTKMHNALLLYGKEDAMDEGKTLALKTIENMKKRLGYNDESAKEVIMFLMKSRYRE